MEFYNQTKLKDFDIEEAKRFRKEGMSYKKIAKLIGEVGEITVAERLNPSQAVKRRKLERIRKTKRKKYLINYKGGECCICGYNKCKAALVFHHLKPEEKSFSIGNRATAPLKAVLKEVDKTLLLCHNCHSEVHQGLHGEFINNYQNHTM